MIAAENVRVAPPEFGDVSQFVIERIHPGFGDHPAGRLLPLVVWVRGRVVVNPRYCDCGRVFELTQPSLNWLQSLAGLPATERTDEAQVCSCEGRLIE